MVRVRVYFREICLRLVWFSFSSFCRVYKYKVWFIQGEEFWGVLGKASGQIRVLSFVIVSVCEVWVLVEYIFVGLGERQRGFRVYGFIDLVDCIVEFWSQFGFQQFWGGFIKVSFGQQSFFLFYFLVVFRVWMR